MILEKKPNPSKLLLCSILLNIKLFTKYLIIHIVERHGDLEDTEEFSAKTVTLIWQKQWGIQNKIFQILFLQTGHTVNSVYWKSKQIRQTCMNYRRANRKRRLVLESRSTTFTSSYCSWLTAVTSPLLCCIKWLFLSRPDFHCLCSSSSIYDQIQ